MLDRVTSRWILIAAGLLAGCFLAGFWNAERQPAISLTPPLIVARQALPVMALATATVAPARQHHARHLTPPPLPDYDPGVAELVNAPREPSAAEIAEADDRDDRQLEELFGPNFPTAKREAVHAAQVTWMREHRHAVQDYYHGEIDQEELELDVHHNMLTWASQIQSALSPDEFRRFTDLDPGTDPYVVLVPPGSRVGDRASSDGS